MRRLRVLDSQEAHSILQPVSQDRLVHWPKALAREEDRVVMIWLLRAALAGGAGAIAAVAAISLTGSDDPATASVITAPAQKGAVLSTVSATGNIAAAESVSVTLPSGTTITSIAVSDGETVTPGQILATVDDTAAQSQLANARATLASAEAQLQQHTEGPSAAERRSNDVAAAQSAQTVTSAQTALEHTKRTAQRSNQGAALATAQAKRQLDQASRAAASARKDRDSARVALATAGKAVRSAESTYDRKTAAFATLTKGLILLQRRQANLQKQQADNNANVTTVQAELSDANAVLGEEEQTLAPLESQRQRSCEPRQGGNPGSETCKDDSRAVAAQQATVDAAQAQVDARRARLASAQNAVRTTSKALTEVGFQITQKNAAISSSQTEQQSAISALQSAEANVERAETEREQAMSSVTQADAQEDSARRGYKTARSNEQATRTQNAQTVSQALASVNQSKSQFDVTIATNVVSEQPATAGTIASARAAVQQARLQVAEAERAVGETVIRAPVAGVVAGVGGAVGETAGGSTGDASGASGLITLTQTRGLGAIAGVNETDASTIRPGQPATVSVDALGGQKFAGHVVSVAPTSTLVSNVVTYEVALALDNPQGNLKPGMTVAIDIVVDQRLNAVNVPTAAVQLGGTGSFVTVLNDDGEQVQVPVTTGLQGDATTAIATGLTAGQLVVLPTLKLDQSKAAAVKKDGLGGFVGK